MTVDISDERHRQSVCRRGASMAMVGRSSTLAIVGDGVNKPCVPAAA